MFSFEARPGPQPARGRVQSVRARTGAERPAVGAEEAEVTEPGTEFEIGQRAVVRIRSGTRFAIIGITVTAIEPADRAVFAEKLGSKAEAEAEKRDPYHVRYTVENLGGIEPFRILTPVLKIVGPDGADASAGRLVFLRPMTDCKHISPNETTFAAVATRPTLSSGTGDHRPHTAARAEAARS